MSTSDQTRNRGAAFGRGIKEIVKGLCWSSLTVIVMLAGSIADDSYQENRLFASIVPAFSSEPSQLNIASRPEDAVESEAAVEPIATSTGIIVEILEVENAANEILKPAEEVEQIELATNDTAEMELAETALEPIDYRKAFNTLKDSFSPTVMSFGVYALEARHAVAESLDAAKVEVTNLSLVLLAKSETSVEEPVVRLPGDATVDVGSGATLAVTTEVSDVLVPTAAPVPVKIVATPTLAEMPVELEVASNSSKIAILNLKGEDAATEGVADAEADQAVVVDEPATKQVPAKPTGHWETRTTYRQVCRGRGVPCDWIPVQSKVWIQDTVATTANAVASTSSSGATQARVVKTSAPVISRDVVSYPYSSQPTSVSCQNTGYVGCSASFEPATQCSTQSGGLFQRVRVRQARQQQSCSNGGFRPLKRIGNFLRSGRSGRCG